MRIGDNPAIGQTQMTGPEAANDIMLLTDVNDLTSGGVAKDKRITIGTLATWAIYRYARNWGSTTNPLDSNNEATGIPAAVNGGEVTLFNIAGTKYVTNKKNSAGTALNPIDFNDYTTPGRYYITRSTISTTGGNVTGTLVNGPPGAINGWLEVLHNGTVDEASAVKKQIFHRQGGQPTSFKGEYFRIYSSVDGTYQWSDWVTLGAEQVVTNYTDSSSNNDYTSMTLADSSNKTICTTGSLTAGTYILIGNVRWANSLGEQGAYNRRVAWFSKSIDSDVVDGYAKQTVQGGNQTQLNVTHIVTINEPTTYYLNVFQDSGKSGGLSTVGALKWLKLHG